MKVRFTSMCRGSGIAYLAVEVVCSKVDSEILFFSTSEKGVSLPLESYADELIQRQTTRHFILATPMLDTRSIAVHVEERGRDGITIAKRVKSISRFALKWSSRLNYRRDFEATTAIRDADQLAYANQIHVHAVLATIAQAKSEYLLKGYICTPQMEDEPVFRLLDSEGMDAGEPNLWVGKSADVSIFDSKRLETPFTLRVPNDGKTRCLVVDGSDGVRSGFLCLDPASQDAYLHQQSVTLFDAAGDGPYRLRSLKRKRSEAFADPVDFVVENGPMFSIVVPLFNTPLDYLDDLVCSVTGQLYSRWELVLVNASPENGALADAVDRLTDSRIRVITLDGNRGIAGNTNAGIEEARGDVIAFMDHDDTLDRFALFKYAQQFAADKNLDVLYCDEDFINEVGDYVSPHFKSDFNLDLLRCHNYITHLLAVRAPLAKELKLRSDFDGAQDYDMVLRLSERTNGIGHIRDVLYHWRMSPASTSSNPESKSYADEAGRRALQEHLDRCGAEARAQLTDRPFFYRIRYDISGDPLVSIVIPNKDNVRVLSRCVDSIFEKTTYRNFEVVIIENNSSSSETFSYYERLSKKYENVRVITWEGEFNYSAINNFGVKAARGEYILLLNNDTEVISPEWLGSMLSIGQRREVGAVGARLLYPDDTVQHAGVFMLKCGGSGDSAGPGHIFNNMDAADEGYFRRAILRQNVSAVTAACLLMKRSTFDEVDGLDESYSVAYNDVDLCLRLREKGYLNVYDADAVLRHYESLSRGSDQSGDNYRRFLIEQGRLRSRWSEYYAEGDPYYTPICHMPGLNLL